MLLFDAKKTQDGTVTLNFIFVSLRGKKHWNKKNQNKALFSVKSNFCKAIQVNTKFIDFDFYDKTRKYPLRRYFLGVLAHTTALDRLWRGDETLNCVAYT